MQDGRTPMTQLSNLERGSIVNGIIVLISVVVVSLLCSCVSSEPGLASDDYYTPSFLQLAGTASTPSYDDLLRYNERYIDELVRYRAKIIRVTEVSENVYECRANVTGLLLWDSLLWDEWEDTVYIRRIGSRLLEDDIIEFVGKVTGLYTYGGTTMPDISLIQAVLIKKAGDKPSIP